MDKPWKVFERRVAAAFRTTRALQKGTATKEDIVSSVFMVDCKLRTNWKIGMWFRELRKAAQKKGKIPVLVVRRPKERLTYVVLEFDNAVSIIKGAGLLEDPDDPRPDKRWVGAVLNDKLRDHYKYCPHCGVETLHHDAAGCLECSTAFEMSRT